jgi:hypothetical protein
MANNMHKQVWRMKVPLKIKVFMWYMKKEVVLTKDNIAKHNWGGSKQCSFCLHNETMQHLFFECYYARFLWGLIQIAFNLPLHIIFNICSTCGQTKSEAKYDINYL